MCTTKLGIHHPYVKNKTMAVCTRSQVTPEMRAMKERIAKHVDSVRKKAYEESQRRKLERKEQNQMKKAAETLVMLSKF